jgi:hypothetical protein
MAVTDFPLIFLAQKLSTLGVAAEAVKQQAQDWMSLMAALAVEVTQVLTPVRLLQGLQIQVVEVAVAGMPMARLVDQVL